MTAIPIRVKICGITNLDDAKVAAAAGADFLGFIFYQKSPRYITPERARSIVAELKSWRSGDMLNQPTSSGDLLPKTVGVFVNEALDAIVTTTGMVGLDYIQLHGDEPPEVLAHLGSRAYKALRPSGNEQAVAQVARYASSGAGDGPCLLLDAYDPDAYGGTGKRTDLTMAAQLARTVPRLILAGGLTPATVARTIEIVRPWGVDVSSGVEAEPGRKDHTAVRQFIAAAKGLTMAG